MTRGARRMLAAGSVLLFLSAAGVQAQQADQTPVTRQPTPAPQKPVPGQSGRDQSRLPQGFSVVLVVADLQASTAPDDVPPAARRALTDMKDFLPYKSYKLVDAAWILGQGTSGTSTRLRGPEEQEYELNLYASRSEGSLVSIRFTLRDATPTIASEEAALQRMKERSEEMLALEQEAARLREQLNEARKRSQEAQVKDLRSRLDSLERRRQSAANRRTPPESSTPLSQAKAGPRRTIIDTSFNMEIGETVVVGTSRLKSNSKALIALLTAVPPKTSRTVDTP